MSDQNPCKARIISDVGIKAFQEAKSYAGQYGIVASVPMISLLRINNSDLESRIWDLTFATSTQIQVFPDKEEVIVSHGVTYDFMREVSSGDAIALTPARVTEIRTALSRITSYSYTDLSNVPVTELPLQYQIIAKKSDLKTPKDLAIMLYGHPSIYNNFQEKYFGQKTCFDLGETSCWLDKILNNESGSWGELLHFGDRHIGTYSDYIGFEQEENHVLGIKCLEEELALTDCADYLKSDSHLR
jgi:hypothetical protein